MLRAAQELYHSISQPQLPKLYYSLQKEQDEICFAIMCLITTCAMQMSWAEVWEAEQVGFRVSWWDWSKTKHKITLAEEPVGPSRDFCTGKLHMQRWGITFNLSLSSFWNPVRSMALARVLRRKCHQVLLILPRYNCIKEGKENKVVYLCFEACRHCGCFA